jgi:putative two-component system response regulator
LAKPFLVCVDDERILVESLRIELRKELGDEFRVESAVSGAEALSLVGQILQEGDDLAVLIADEKMPGMPGHELLAQVSELCPSTALVLMTGYSDADAIRDAVNVGLYRYFTKPWRIDDLVFTVRQAQRLRARQKVIDERHRSIGRLTRAMGSALETVNRISDESTDRHIDRITEYAVLLATRSGTPAPWVERLRLYAGLHDVGKAGIACQLPTVGPYTAEERALQNLHVVYGGQILGTDGVDPMAANIARYHHERWDGRGYLEHLVGEAIPLEARIVALVDVFDALASPRPYREAMPFDGAFNQIVTMGGTWFDPRLVLVFRECCDELRAIRDRINAPGPLPSRPGFRL